MAPYAVTALLAASCFRAAAAAPGVGNAIPVTRKTVSADVANAVAAIKGRTLVGVAPLVDDQGFWFSNFTIGNSLDYEILIDTGSSDAITNPGEYKPSAHSVNTGRTFTITYATTNPDGSGTVTLDGKIYQDTISQHGTNLTVQKQYLGEATSPTSPPPFPHDGLIGYAGQDSSALGEPPFIHSLCTQGSLPECRFGTAFKTDGTGSLYYGEIGPGEFNGSLSTAPIQDEWILYGDIAFDGKVIQKKATIITDSGTTIIFGPVAPVKALFQAAGIQAVENAQGTAVTGYFNCSAPPTLGFGFPSEAVAGTGKASATSTIFNILPELLVMSKNGNNCTASIHGTNSFGSDWLVGQVFFQGRYIDHNIAAGTMGFADLTNP